MAGLQGVLSVPRIISAALALIATGVGVLTSSAQSNNRFQMPDDERRFLVSYQLAVTKLRQAGSAESRAGAEALNDIRELSSSLNGKAISHWTCRYTSPSRTKIPFVWDIDPCVTSGDPRLNFTLLFDYQPNFSMEVFPDDVVSFTGVAEPVSGSIRVHLSDVKIVQKGP